MKLTLEQIKDGEEEVHIRYLKMNEKVEQIIHLVEGKRDYIIALKDSVQHKVFVKDILYCESVERSTFLYTREELYQVSYTLHQLELECSSYGFFRCSKNMVLNINHMMELRSLSGNRIDAKLSNEEHVIISRRYAGELRRKLRGDNDE